MKATRHAPMAVMAGPQTIRGLRPRVSPMIPDGMFIISRASAYADSVVPTAAAPTPKLCKKTDIWYVRIHRTTWKDRWSFTHNHEQTIIPHSHKNSGA